MYYNLFLNNHRCFIPIALLTLSLGTLNNPKTCRMVDLIDHYNELPSATNIKNTFWDTYTPYGIIVKQEEGKD